MTIPTWERLYKIRQLSLYNFSMWTLVLVPVLASAIIFLREHQQIQLAIPVNMVAIYLAALFFYISSIATDIFCPDPIKEHKNFETFLQSLIGKVELIANVRRRTTAEQDAAIDELSTNIRSRIGASGDDDKMNKLLIKIYNEQGVIKMMNEAGPSWMTGNNQRLHIRALIVSGFLISAVAALYVSLIDAPSRVCSGMLPELEFCSKMRF